MKSDMVTKAIEIRLRGNIERDISGNFYVPSFSSEAIYIISASGLCNCPAMKNVCSHALAAFNACTPVQQFRWANDYDELLLVAEVHKTTISQMPERLRVFCRQEFSTAKQRLQGEQQIAA